MVLTWSATTRKAVEKAGPWTRWKTKPRFPTASTAPWKSRKPSEIPTFPPPLRFALSLPNQRRRGLLEAKPDNSRVNKTGQLDLLTTVGGILAHDPILLRQGLPIVGKS